MKLQKTKLSTAASLLFTVVVSTSALSLTTTPVYAQSITSIDCTNPGTESGNSAFAVTCGSTAKNTAGFGSIAAGNGATASDNSTVIGTFSSDNGNANNTIYGTFNNAYDANNYIAGYNSTIGQPSSNGSGTAQYNLLTGINSSISAFGSYSALYGVNATTSGSYNFGAGYNVNIQASNSVAIGPNSSIFGGSDGSVAIGSLAQVTALGSVAIGQGSASNGANSVDIGAGAQSTGSNNVVMGAGASTNNSNSVAMGAGSTTTRNLEFSVGAPGATRVISNVTAGTLPTDAVNVQQLDTAIAGVSGGGATIPSVSYPTSTISDLDLQANGGNGTTISHVANGVNAQDAINMSQAQAIASAYGAGAGFTNGIWQAPQFTISTGTYTTVNGVVQALDGRITNLQNQVNNLPTGGTGTGSSTDANAVHYTNGSGSGDVSINGGGQIHNVNDGTASTDAANVGQVNAAAQSTLNQANVYTDNKFNQIQKAQTVSSIDYNKSTNANLVLQDNNGQGTTVSNVADGVAQHDAVNVGQLNNAIAPLQNQMNSQQNQISDLYNQVGDLKDRINSVGASAMAASSLVPMPGNVGDVQLGAAVGEYGGQSAIAVGGFYNTGNAIYNIKFTGATKGGLGVGAGATFVLKNLF